MRAANAAVLVVGVACVAMALSCATGPMMETGHKVPRAVYKPAPVYPDGAYSAGLKGSVEVGLFVDDLGASQNVKVLSEDPPGVGFGESALEAVRSWVWHPAEMNGMLVGEAWKVKLVFDPVRSERIRPFCTLVERHDCPRPDGFAKDREGGVMLQVSVGLDGAPESISVMRESPANEGLGRAAKQCVQSWKWSPGLPGQTYVVVWFKPEA